jgi:type IV secretion system protein VirD4
MSTRLYFGYVKDDRTGLWRRVKYDGENSMILAAPPGSGKFTRQVAPTLLTYPGSVFVFDPKGQAAAVTARYRRTLGDVYVLDPFDVLLKLGIKP